METENGTRSPADVDMGDGSSWNRQEWKDVSNVLFRGSPFADSDFNPGQDTAEFMATQAKLLVIGAGGLGCEILKGLALSGFRNITVIDMDHIDVTNLNRQFLFRAKDVGQPKSVVAANFINERFGHLGVRVTPMVGKIQDHGEDFYSQFTLIIAGLDNINARRWINSMLHSMVQRDEEGNIDPSTIKAMLDGGTEGFKGQSRVIVPTVTSCFECSLDSFPPQVNFPMCTIAETPRLPEHCIEYALVVLWEKEFKDKKPDSDSPEDMQWIYQRAAERADQFKIPGVTYSLTLGVVKRIIPAVASTNAFIAASLCSEAVKMCTYSGPALNSYMMYMGHNGVYTHTFEYEKKEGCLVCTSETCVVQRSSDITLEEFIQSLVEDERFRLQRPSIACGNSVVFHQSKHLRQQHEHKLAKTLQELVEEGVIVLNSEMVITDPTLTSQLKIKLAFGN
eukprot:GDKI01032309.1.p1 GENE.GDKI01032309.1~~GDKI01032309.1.p1  ORF type:complete len:451 (-),score=144.27 GDKI01032309.1:193-1545(-)